MKASIRKLLTLVEETYQEMNRSLGFPTKKAAAIAVISNPYAGRYEENLDDLIEIGAELGRLLGERAVIALGGDPSKVESFGKGAIVGLGGELEHAAAVLHPRLGRVLRDVIGAGKAIIPSSKKVGGAGSSLDVPLHYKDAAYVRTHFDAMEVYVPDAPRDDEIVVAIVLTDSGRPLARVPGLTKSEIKGEDGLR